MKSKTLHGTLFRIDRPKGYTKKWSATRQWTYPVDYGYLPRYHGEDGEALDFFVGDKEDGCLECFQKLKKNDDGKYVLDETKFLVGLTDEEREKIYRFYGNETGKRTTFSDWEELMAYAQKFKPARKPRYKEAYWTGVKEASRDNPWPSIRTEGPIVGEDKDYEHAQRHFKFAYLLAAKPQNADVGGAAAPSMTPVAPPKVKKPPVLKPIPVPQSSAPQVMQPKQAGAGDGFVAPSSPPDKGFLRSHVRAAEDGAVKTQIDNFFRDKIDNQKNVTPTGTESAHGAIY